jgi:uncharacterized protein
LKELENPIDEEFDLYYDVTNKHELDITDDIREQLIFLHQQKYLCSDNCKGICPHCGKDRNSQPCDCEDSAGIEEHTRVPAKGFEQLNELKKKLHDREKEK